MARPSDLGPRPTPGRAAHRAVLPALALAAIVFALTVGGAGASLSWCRSDPIVEVGGRRAHVYVASPVDVMSAASGPTRVVITVPAGVSTQFIEADNGFGYGWSVSFAESDQLRVATQGIEVRVSTYVPARATMPVMTDVTNGGGAVLGSSMGTTNGWTTTKVWL
jgi:hypothetical protein